ncbi:MAG: hypothetical protein KKB20_12070 [Proteobacteria bacterium]|nr:hypothetical protein [Pseudomonadota bacterium]
MQSVGDKLAELACEPGRKVEDVDVFGRSAFNRYYYASYLITRKMLFDLNPNWVNTRHKNIPELLRKTIISRIRDQIRKQSKKGLITKSKEQKIRNDINDAVSELSLIIAEAYNIRVIADYRPDNKIFRKHKDLILENKSLNEAKKWSGRASMFSKKIIRIWKDVGL